MLVEVGEWTIKDVGMNVVADIAIIPIGEGVSLSRYIAACETILTKSGLNPQFHSNGTNFS